mmetsp:Transcript_9770/g.12823  ORF Transcript_9770/g.12823 Transcript_9770/m.12823 type:complete len:89 (+) Transcript_9770:2386-2652(+)
MSRLELWIECLFQQCLPFFLILKQIILILMHMKLLPMNASTLCLGHQGLIYWKRRTTIQFHQSKMVTEVSVRVCVCVLVPLITITNNC